MVRRSNFVWFNWFYMFLPNAWLPIFTYQWERKYPGIPIEKYKPVVATEVFSVCAMSKQKKLACFKHKQQCKRDGKRSGSAKSDDGVGIGCFVWPPLRSGSRIQMWAELARCSGSEACALKILIIKTLIITIIHITSWRPTCAATKSIKSQSCNYVDIWVAVENGRQKIRGPAVSASTDQLQTLSQRTLFEGRWGIWWNEPL